MTTILTSTQVKRELGMSSRSMRSWLEAWEEVVGPLERVRQAGPTAFRMSADDFQLLWLARKIVGDNIGRVDMRRALRKAAFFVGRPTVSAEPYMELRGLLVVGERELQ